MTLVTSNVRLLVVGAAFGMFFAGSASAQTAIVPTDFAVADVQAEPQPVVAPLPPSRTTLTATPRATRAAPVVAARPAPQREQLAFADQPRPRRTEVSWPVANRPNFMWLGVVY